MKTISLELETKFNEVFAQRVECFDPEECPLMQDRVTLEDVMRKLFSLADGWRYDFDCNGIHRQHETSGKAFICGWNLNGEQTEETYSKLLDLVK